MSVRILQGDALSMLKTLPDKSVQAVVTSPPYFQPRSYLPSDHPDKANEIGLEQTPAAFLDALYAVFDEVKRVLRDDGCVFVNLGDSYAGSGNGPQAHRGRRADVRERGGGRMSASEFDVTDLGHLACGAQECTRTRRYRVEMIGSPIKPVEVCKFHREWAKRWLEDRHNERRRRLKLCPKCGLDQLGSVDSCDCPGADTTVNHPYQRRGSWSGDEWCAVEGCTSRPSAHASEVAS